MKKCSKSWLAVMIVFVTMALFRRCMHISAWLTPGISLPSDEARLGMEGFEEP